MTDITKPLRVMPEVYRLPDSDRRWCRMSHVVILIDDVGSAIGQSIDMRPNNIIYRFGYLSPVMRRIVEIPDSDARVFFYHHNGREQYVVAERIGTTIPIDTNEMLQMFVDTEWVKH